jgi:hypothetical protein
MPDSDLRQSVRSAGHAAACLLAIAGVLWGGAYVSATSRPALGLYSVAFDNAVAHRFAGRLEHAQGRVLLLGASSTHDGFDEEVMNHAAPPAAFVNGGTGMGSVFVYEALTVMLRDSGVKPSVVVLGLHPVTLADRQINFNGAGYTDFFDRWHGWNVLQFDDPLFLGEDRHEALANSVWPGHRLARQTGRLVRSAMYRLHTQWYWGRKLPAAAFERAPDFV